MTALCPGGGASAPKPLTAAVVDYSAGLLGNLLLQESTPWLIPVIPLLTLAPLVLSTFCGTDPPSVPTFTLAETDALLKITIGPDFVSGLAKFKDYLLNLIWYDSCECSSGTATALVPPSAPSGTQIIQYPGGFQSTPCAQGEFVHSNAGLGGSGNFDNSPWWGPGINWVCQATPCFHNVPTGAAWSQATITYHNVTTAGAGATWVIKLAQNTVGSFTYRSTDPHQQTATLTPGQTMSLTMFYDANAPYFAENFAFSGAGTSDIHATLVLYCSGGPGGFSNPCCPPDPVQSAYLENILAAVTLIQRQIAPFAYVPGTVHSGLSGTGSFSVSGILGLAVDITTAPARLGTVLGDPDQLFGAGWINVGTADGWGPREFISSDPFLLRPVPGDITLVGYSIPSDVTVSITELIREP